MRQKQSRIDFSSPNVVGTIHTAGGFAAAGKSAVDVVEVRVDSLPTPPEAVHLAALPKPVILTVRRFDEGGSRPLDDGQRAALYLELLCGAAAIDLEVASLRSGDLQPVLKAARKKKVPVIASFHDFSTTPSLARLKGVVARAREAGADVVKVATKTEKPEDVAVLLTLLGQAEGPVSVMGMGTLGRASRLLLAKAGSVLNYAWLHQPQVPGQWSARDFCKLFAGA